jgi:hypothetical protein
MIFGDGLLHAGGEPLLSCAKTYHMEAHDYCLGNVFTYTSPTRQSFVVSVAADVVNPTNGERKNSNMFHFIF